MRDEVFVQHLRRHRPSALLPLVAELASQRMEPVDWTRPGVVGLGTPWALAEITRVSVAYSNEHRGDAVATDALVLNDDYNELDDPELVDPSSPIAGFFLRMSQQLAYQEKLLNEFARTTAILCDTTPEQPMQVIRPGWDEELYGGSLGDFVAAGQLLQTACKPNAGRFNPRWLDQPNFEFLRDVLDIDRLRKVMEAHFVITSAEFVEANGRPSPSSWRRFSYNPLLGRPVISGLPGPSGDWLIPVPGVLVRRVSMLGVYYDGVSRFGKAFADDLGDLFEQYVGRQLRLIPDAEVHPAVTVDRYGSKSVDWTVILPELVLLVEVKSVRPTQEVRAGGPGAGEELSRMLSKGVRQLGRDHERAVTGHPAFSFVPQDRPFLGLLVTMEDFHVINSVFHRDLYRDDPIDLPVGVISARDLEGLVTVDDVTTGALLVEASTQSDDPGAGFNVRYRLPGHRFRRNEVVRAAWDSSFMHLVTATQGAGTERSTD